jgi:flagellar protein FlgJ
MNINPIFGGDYVTQGQYAADKEGTEISAFQAALEAAANSRNDEEIRKACIEFESYFLNMIFKQMRKTVDAVASEKKSNAADIYYSWFDEKVANEAALQGGIGLADFMYRQMTAYSKTITVDEYYQAILASKADADGGDE